MFFHALLHASEPLNSEQAVTFGILRAQIPKCWHTHCALPG